MHLKRALYRYKTLAIENDIVAQIITLWNKFSIIIIRKKNPNVLATNCLKPNVRNVVSI